MVAARGRPGTRCGGGSGGLTDGEAALVHDADPLGPAGDGGVVGDQDQGQAAFPPQVFQQDDDVVAGVLIQVASRLVGQQHPGLLDQSPGDRGPLLLLLLLPAGQLGGQVAGPVGQADLVQRGGYPAAARGVADAERDQRGLDVLGCRQGEDQVEGLQDEPDRLGAQPGELGLAQRAQAGAVQLDGAFGGPVQAAEQGGLCRSRCGPGPRATRRRGWSGPGPGSPGRCGGRVIGSNETHLLIQSAQSSTRI
jgi:hypothetical protein